jgi:hypothetical protein
MHAPPTGSQTGVDPVHAADNETQVPAFGSHSWGVLLLQRFVFG